MEDAVLATKQILDLYFKGLKIRSIDIFKEYDKVYATTTENINGYLSKFDFTNKTDALTVLASGDQAFSLASLGISNITTFDINKLTEYYALGLKRSAIWAFTYKEYLTYFQVLFDPNTSLKTLTDMIRHLFPYMEPKYKTYWQQITDYNYKLQLYRKNPINLFHILNYSTAHGISKLKNSYLITEERYNYLRSIINKINITFDPLDVFDLPNVYEKTYDFILLSNIADYIDFYLGPNWTYESFRKEIVRFHKLLKQDGIIFIAYLLGRHKKVEDTFDTPLIYPSLMKISDLTQEELIILPHIENDREFKLLDDALILERKLS